MAKELCDLEYPRHVHAPSVPGDWKFLVVNTAKECEAALDEGWSLVPIVLEVPPEPEAEPGEAEPEEEFDEEDEEEDEEPLVSPLKRGGKKK